MGEDPIKALGEKQSEGPEAIREQIKVGDVVEKNGERLTVLALVGEEEALLSPQKGGEEEVANTKDLKKVSTTGTKGMPDIGSFPLAPKKEKPNIPIDVEPRSKIPEGYVDEFFVDKRLKEQGKSGEPAVEKKSEKTKERMEFEKYEEKLKEGVTGTMIEIKGSDGLWEAVDLWFDDDLNEAVVRLKKNGGTEEKIINRKEFSNAVIADAKAQPKREDETVQPIKKTPEEQARAMGVSFIKPAMARSAESLPDTVIMSADELAAAEKKENEREKINKAKNLKELEEAIEEVGEIEGPRGKAYKAEDINERLEQLCAHIKETRTKMGRQWWDEKAVGNMARSIFGITNGAEKGGLRIRDAIIKLLRPENADWLLEDKQEEPGDAQKESMAKLEEKIKKAKTFDDLTRALTEADEEAKKHGHEVQILGSQESYGVKELTAQISTVKKAIEEGREEHLPALLRYITRTMGMQEAVERIAKDTIDTKKRADAFADMLGENPLK
jgi:hypothetical protein